MIKCLKGQKSQRCSLNVFVIAIVFVIVIVFLLVMSPRHSDQMSQESKVSQIALHHVSSMEVFFLQNYELQ